MSYRFLNEITNIDEFIGHAQEKHEIRHEEEISITDKHKAEKALDDIEEILVKYKNG